MLAANEAVAHEIKNRPAACIYRVHDKPDPERLADLRHTLGVSGVRVGDLTNRNEVTKFLAALRGRTDEARLKIEFLKSLRRAAYSPDLPGCVSTGETRDSCQSSMHEAIEFHLDGLREEGEAVPVPVSSAAFVEVA